LYEAKLGRLVYRSDGKRDTRYDGVLLVTCVSPRLVEVYNLQKRRGVAHVFHALPMYQTAGWHIVCTHRTQLCPCKEV
jgi:hypothetical protein